jgi:hypothetical protein
MHPGLVGCSSVHAVSSYSQLEADLEALLAVKCDSTLSLVTGTPQLNRFRVSVAGSTRLRHEISSIRWSSLNSPESSTGDVYTCPTLPYHQVV